LEAELLAIKEGISLSLQWSNLRIDIESDCLEAISMVKEGVANRSKNAFIVRGIILSMVERNSCIVLLVGIVTALVISWLTLIGCKAEPRFGYALAQKKAWKLLGEIVRLKIE
jgi:hypothetical protein